MVDGKHRSDHEITQFFLYFRTKKVAEGVRLKVETRVKQT